VDEVQARARTRLAMIRATEEALDRRPELTVAVVRSQLERSARRRTDEPLARRVGTDLALRAIDVHPAVGERIVRLWLRRAAERERQALESSRSGHRERRGRSPGSSADRGDRATARSQ
jgi:hypothetical protein